MLAVEEVLQFHDVSVDYLLQKMIKKKGTYQFESSVKIDAGSLRWNTAVTLQLMN